MDRAGRVALRIVYGFVVAVIIASCLVVTIAQHQRADKATARAERIQGKLIATQDELAIVQDDLDYTSGNLETVSYEVSRVSQTLDATKSQRDKLATQNAACRQLIRINDQLLAAMTSQQNATRFVMHDKNKRAARSLQRAAGHVHAVQAIVKRSGHTSIDGLIRACSPSS